MSGALLSVSIVLIALCGLGVVMGIVGVGASLFQLRMVRAIEWAVLLLVVTIAGTLIGASIGQVAGEGPTGLLS
ncbi:hypothetical protein [Microbacterium deminutum]|uniref:Uncharacterized protein n=1 Tax=Microbacterium deminutum TaxID=344164 RepID=A0ABN2R1F9_9MICO